MAGRNEVAKATIYLDGKQAESALEGLKRRAEELRTALKEANNAGDTVKMKKIQSEVIGIESATRSLKKETFDYESVLKNLNGSSLNDLKKSLRTIEIQMGKMKRSDPGFAHMQLQAKSLNSEIRKVNLSMKEQTSSLRKVADAFNNYQALAMGAVAAFAGISLAVKGAIKGFNDYQDRVANLSALTGLAGEDLKYLSDQARQLGTAVLDGGVLVTNGSQDIVDAFTKVGSARPELLKNKEALVDVTKNAMILSSASKEELAPSIAALTMVMNQYNTSATEARRIINVLAAGSKEGAGEIPYLTMAFEKAGTVAADAGLSIETLTATIETLAPRITAPEIAGRSLKGVLLKLQQGADDTNPAIVGMATALENLGKKNLSVTQLTKMFGTENITAGKILINNVAELRKYEAAVTGTNIALQQGAINTATNSAKIAQAKERFRQLSDELGGNLSPIYASIISKSALMLKSLSALIKFLVTYGREIMTVVTALAAYTVAVKISANWTKIQTAYTYAVLVAETAYGNAKAVLTGKIKLATVAQKGWNLAMKANPIGLIVSLIAGAIVWLIQFDKKTGKVSQALRKAGDFVIDLANQFIELYNSSIPVRIAVEYIVSVFKTGFAIAKASVVSLLNPLKLVGNLIKAALTFDVEGIKDAYKDFGKDVKENVTGTIQDVGKIWETGIDKALHGKMKPITRNVTIKTNGIADEESSGGPLNVNAGDKNKLPGILTEDDEVDITEPSGEDKIKPAGSDKGKMKTAEELAKEELNQKIKMLDDANKIEVDAITKRYNQQKSTEEQYKAELLSQELKFISDKMSLLDKGSAEYADLETSYNEKQIQAREKMNELIAKADEQLQQAKIDNLEDGIEKEKNLEEKRWNEELEKLENQLIEKQELSDQEAGYNDKIYALIELKKAEHLKRMQNLTTASDIQKKLDSALIDEANAQTDAEKFEAKRAIVKANYDQEIADAQGNAVKIAQANRNLSDDLIQIKLSELEAINEINDEKWNLAIDGLGVLSELVGEETALGKALFLMQQAAAIGQVVFNTAIANAKAVAASPITFGQPWVGINTAMAAVSIATIVGQSIKKFTGGKKEKTGTKNFYEGGYTSPGDKYEPAGVVHAGEWVANRELVKSPVTSPVIGWLEMIRKSGAMATINLPALQAAPRGYAAGGPVKSDQIIAAAVNDNSVETNRALTDAIERLMKWEPAVAVELIQRGLKTLDNINKNSKL